MATLLESARDELYLFFEKEIAPIIRKEEHNKLLCKHIVMKLNSKFGKKYNYLAKQHGNTIRIAVDYCQLGIIFFMAETKLGQPKTNFADPCYWARQTTKIIR